MPVNPPVTSSFTGEQVSSSKRKIQARNTMNIRQAGIGFIALAMVSSGCAGMTDTQQRTVTGGAAGAAGGALIGAIAGNAGMGAAIGAGVGLTGGYLYGKHKESEQQAYKQGYQSGKNSKP